MMLIAAVQPFTCQRLESAMERTIEQMQQKIELHLNEFSLSMS
jgi:hypothetical protein